ncbi:MAG: glutamate-1-semialdehyde 2,1-aminomutase [Hydrogenophilus sp.]|nr:glutamate-1-semialdehyde 2,1-aminomutase [Hydrogenophilus sp.]
MANDNRSIARERGEIGERRAMSEDRNEVWWRRATAVIPGGVNSPVRAFRAVGGVPRFIRRAEGPFVWDESERRYVDFVGSWGPAIAGHAHPRIVAAVQEAARDGLSFGAPTVREVLFAERLQSLLPSLERVRLVSSGTEATMSAVRLARGVTGRSLVVKFEGCYHGHVDGLLVKAGSGALTFGHPSSAGVPAAVAQETLVLEYNDSAGVERVFAEHGERIAAVIVEPIAGNMNLIKPQEGFLEGLRRLCTRYGSVLIFDEVMTGFRVGLQGAQGLYGVVPDLTTLGKVIGGGMPLAAFGGRRELMEELAPLGAVYQAGTLSGSPVAVAAGLAALELVSEPGFFERLAERTRRLAEGLKEAARRGGVAFTSDWVGGMFGIYFSPTVPRSFQEVVGSNVAQFRRFFHAMLARGFYFAPSAFEAGFVSAAHGEEVIEETVTAAEEVFAELASEEE